MFPPAPPCPPLFLAVYFCFVFENLYSTSPHFPLQFIQASCIHIDLLLLRVYDTHPTVAHVRTDLSSVDTSVAAIFHSAQKQLSISHIITSWGIYQTQTANKPRDPTNALASLFLGFPLERSYNTPSNVREFVHRVKQSIICSRNMAAPSMRLVRSVKKHRRHSETSLMRRNTDKARTSAIESPPCFFFSPKNFVRYQRYARSW